MFRKLALLAWVVGLALQASAAGRPGTISGYVRDASGVPQMGAMVEVLGPALSTLHVFTSETGFYSAKDLLPGVYNIKVSAPSFLPALREKVGLRAGAAVTVNVTLNTLFEAIRLGPMRGPSDDDDWKWVLRSAANRPILRALDDGTSVVASESRDEHDLKGTLAFFAGSPSAGFGSTSDVSTGFSLEKSLYSAGTLAFSGNVGYGSSSPAAVLHASYRHAMGGGEPQIAFTMRRLASPDAGLHNADLQALALSTSDKFSLGDILELQFGSELQTIQFMGRVTAFRPFGTIDAHLSQNVLLQYRYATSQPDSRMEKGFDSAPADLSESGPHVSISRFSPALERASHHEVSLSRRSGKNVVQLAAYYDRITDPALTGVGDVSSDRGEVLPDLYSGTFTYQGRDLEGGGLRVVLQRKLTPDVTATVDYDYGAALDLSKDNVSLQDARNAIVSRDRQSVAAKVNGTVPRSKTMWIASYRWTDGRALTPVDAFNTSAGQADPYLNFFVRQPIPGTSFLPGHMDALVEVRNLLAQGYVPVLGQDGRTVYLVQSARAVRGGVAFTF